MLLRLATVWLGNPPPGIDGPSAYAPHFDSYAGATAEQYARPAPDDLPRWLRDNAAALSRGRNHRRLNGTVAVALLEPFLEDPSLWRDCRWLNRWDPAADATFADYLHSWSACLLASGIEPRAPVLIGETLLPG